MIRSTRIGRLLCRLGLHRYEWRTRVAADGTVVDQVRCRRFRCALDRWRAVNVERRPW